MAVAKKKREFIYSEKFPGRRQLEQYGRKHWDSIYDG